jgi:hypothetical protein
MAHSPPLMRHVANGAEFSRHAAAAEGPGLQVELPANALRPVALRFASSPYGNLQGAGPSLVDADRAYRSLASVLSRTGAGLAALSVGRSASTAGETAVNVTHSLGDSDPPPGDVAASENRQGRDTLGTVEKSSAPLMEGTSHVQLERLLSGREASGFPDLTSYLQKLRTQTENLTAGNFQFSQLLGQSHQSQAQVPRNVSGRIAPAEGTEKADQLTAFLQAMLARCEPNAERNRF